MDRLSYTTNDEIADLFTSLLTNASSRTTVNLAHPAFIQIIERLSLDEARLIKYLNNKDFIPCVSFRAYFLDGIGFQEIKKNVNLLESENTLLFPANIPMYLENLVSLGILDISHGLHKTNEEIYKPLIEIHQFEIFKKAFMRLPILESLFLKRVHHNDFIDYIPKCIM